MKSFKLAALLMTISQPAWAYHNFFFRSADDITSGTLNPLRLDASSVTMLGPTIEPNEINGNPGLVSIYNNANSPLGNINTLRVTNVPGASAITVSNATGTINISADVATAMVVVGTSSARGAQIIGTKTEVFGFAAATANARGGGIIFVQKGDYFFNQETTGTLRSEARLHWIFEDSATIRYADNEILGTAFFMSSTVVENVYVYITTAVYRNAHRNLFEMGVNGRLIRPNVWAQYTQTTDPAKFRLFNFGPGSRDSVIEYPIVSSFTVMSCNSTCLDQIHVIDFNQSTRSLVIEPYINQEQSTNLGNQYNTIHVWQSNSNTIRGGFIKMSGRFLISNFFETTGLIEDFIWRPGPVVNNYAAPNSGSGLILFQSDQGSQTSTGCVLSGFNITHHFNNFSIDTLKVNTNNMLIENFDIHFKQPALANTGGGFNIGGANNILLGNKIWGTSDCITTSGTDIRMTGNDNFCNGAEQ